MVNTKCQHARYTSHLMYMAPLLRHISEFDGFPLIFDLHCRQRGGNVHLDPLLMSVAPETLPTWRTGYLSNIVEGLRLKMKIDEVMAILR